MNIPRLFIETPLQAGATVAATAEQAHYLGTVMRRAVGDPLIVFNGQDGAWSACVSELRRDRLRISVQALRQPQRVEDGPWLVFALLKRDATDLVVQKATELGAAALMPVLTERTNAARVNESRLRAIAVEAAEQSERLTVPRIHPPQRLFDLLESWPANRRLFAALERQDGPRPAPGAEPSALLVGPEGGFASPELDALKRYKFVAPVTLGPRILRAETACLAGLALLQVP